MVNELEELNRAVASSMAFGPAGGLEIVEAAAAETCRRVQ